MTPPNESSARRIEIRPTGTNGRRSCEARLYDEHDGFICTLPARFAGHTETDPEYVVIDLAPGAPPLWGGQ